MKKLVLLLLLAGCSSIDTPEEKYFATISMVKSTGEIVETYVVACKEQPVDADCRKKFPAINTAAKSLKDAMRQADKVFVTKDSEYYDLSLSMAQNAAMNLRNILKE